MLHVFYLDYCTDLSSSNQTENTKNTFHYVCLLSLSNYFILRSKVMPSPQFFDGQALVSWSETDVTVAVPWYMGLMFRTRQPAGTLMQANAGRSSTITLMVRFSKTHSFLFVEIFESRDVISTML